jgi:hypothetical protein
MNNFVQLTVFASKNVATTSHKRFNLNVKTVTVYSVLAADMKHLPPMSFYSLFCFSTNTVLGRNYKKARGKK